MESKRIAWSHLFLLAALAILHRRSHAQPPGTSSTWVSDVLKVSLKKARFSVVLTGFFSCIVFLIFLSLLIRHCVRSCARSNRRATRAAAQRRLRQVMEQCPVLEYSEVKALRIGNCALDCAVCLTEFGDTENVRLLPQCNHVFHPDCIDQWFASRLTCPVCRAKLCPSDDDNAAADAATESNQEESPAADGEIERQSAEESPEETIDEIGSAGLPTETELPIWSTTAPARFARSHSTGISLERYALRLPEHVREEIFRNQRELRRCASSNDVALPVEWSSKRGIDDHQTKKWAFLSLTPPFVSKNLSSDKFLKLSTDGSSSRRRLPV